MASCTLTNATPASPVPTTIVSPSARSASPLALDRPSGTNRYRCSAPFRFRNICSPETTSCLDCAIESGPVKFGAPTFVTDTNTYFSSRVATAVVGFPRVAELTTPPACPCATEVANSPANKITTRSLISVRSEKVWFMRRPQDQSMQCRLVPEKNSPLPACEHISYARPEIGSDFDIQFYRAG
jgi:hypothetical protein